MLKIADLRSALFTLGLLATAAQPAIADDLVDLLSAGVPSEILSVLRPVATRDGGGAFAGTVVEDNTYGAALFSLHPTLDSLADDIFSEVKNLPVAPGVAAFIYELDPETNEYKRTGDGLGAIYSDRPQTLGKGRLNFGVAWSHIEYDEFSGTSLRNLPIQTAPNQAVVVSSTFPDLDPGSNAAFSIVYPEGLADGETFPEAGLFWNLMGSDQSGAVNCQVQGGEICSGTIPAGASLPDGYHFESWGVLGDYLVMAGDSSDINVNLHLDVELINVYLAYGVTDRFDIGLVMPFMENDVGVDVDVITPFVPADPDYLDPVDDPNGLLYSGSAALCMGDARCLFEEFALAHAEKYEQVNTAIAEPCVRACKSRPGLRADAFSRTLKTEFYGANTERITYSAWGNDGGIGDLLIRGKYRFLDSRYLDMAGRLDISFPTGSEDNFRGTGEYMWGINLIASKTIGWLAPHANLGVQLRTGGKENHQFRWAIGADARVHRRASVSVDFLGNEDLHHDGIGDTQMSLAPGVKYNPWRNFLITAGVLIQLNHQGLRTDVIPTLGVEYTFF